MGGALGGALIGGGMEATGQAIQIWQQKKAAKKAFERQKKILQNRFQWQAADLEAAGLNRILAVTQGTSAAANVQQANVGSIGQGMSANLRQAMLAREQQKLLQAQTGKTLAEKELAEAGVPTAEAKEDLMKWLFDQARRAIGGGAHSAKQLLSPEAKEAFRDLTSPLKKHELGERRSMNEKYFGGKPIKVNKFKKGER